MTDEGSTEAMEAVYRRFRAIYADGIPVRDPEELAAAVRASGARVEDVDDAWLRALRRAWVYGDADEPFEDDRANRNYRRELMG